MFSSGKFQVRAWMFIYLGFIAAILLSGNPRDAGDEDLERFATPSVRADSPLIRHDI